MCGKVPPPTPSVSKLGTRSNELGTSGRRDYTQTDLSNLATDPACKEISLEMRNSGGSRVVKLAKTNLFP